MMKYRFPHISFQIYFLFERVYTKMLKNRKVCAGNLGFLTKVCIGNLDLFT